MIKTGKTRRQIKTIIDEHTYKGVRANLEFSKWSKTNGSPTIYQHLIKNLFTYQDIQDGYQKRKEEKRGMKLSQDILNFFDEHLKEMHDYKLPKVVRNKLESGVLGLDVMPSMRCLMTNSVKR